MAFHIEFTIPNLAVDCVLPETCPMHTTNQYCLRITDFADTIHNYERHLQGERAFHMMSSHSLDDPFFAILCGDHRARVEIYLSPFRKLEMRTFHVWSSHPLDDPFFDSVKTIDPVWGSMYSRDAVSVLYVLGVW